MTDPTEPRSPSGTTVIEDRVRATLRAAAPAHTHVEAGLADLRARLDGEVVVPLRKAPTGLAPWRRTLLVAAAVLALVGAVGLGLVLAGGDDDGEPMRTVDQPAPATGWYVPADLPDGWAVQSVTSDYQDLEGFGGTCPCPRTTWLADDGSSVMTLSSATNPGPLDVSSLGSEPEEIVLSPEHVGAIFRMTDGMMTIAWLAQGRQWQLAGVGVVEDEFVTSAVALSDDPAAGQAGGTVPAGYHELSRSTAPGGIEAFQAVTVTLRNEERGVAVGYTLAPSGLGSDPATFLVPGDARTFGRPPLWRYEPLDTAPEGELPLYFGQWPGADVSFGDDGAQRLVDGPVTQADIETVIGSLRPASAAEWRAFVARSTEPAEDDTVAPTLDDLTVPGEARTGD